MAIQWCTDMQYNKIQVFYTFHLWKERLLYMKFKVYGPQHLLKKQILLAYSEITLLNMHEKIEKQRALHCTKENCQYKLTLTNSDPFSEISFCQKCSFCFNEFSVPIMGILLYVLWNVPDVMDCCKAYAKRLYRGCGGTPSTESAKLTQKKKKKRVKWPLRNHQYK